MTNEKDKLLLKAKLEVDGEGRLFQGMRDATTLGTFWGGCMDMGALVAKAQASGRQCLKPRLEPTARALHARRRSP